ncbi:hypothetical protein Ancab_029274 [Ancistrocladus abbreviatus]
MPLLDIAIARPSFESYLGSLGVHQSVSSKDRNNVTFRNKKMLGLLWMSSEHFERLNLNLRHCGKRHSKFLIKAVLTLEAESPVMSEDRQEGLSNLPLIASSGTPKVHVELSNEGLEELDEREKLRRMRISKANKGKTPWNKGRKHSAETLKRIRERTKLAMQNPKVKMKLMKLGHAQRPCSKETRTKIGAGVRIGWQRRREKLMLQETCFLEWRNLVAEAARMGLVHEEELQWDSYEILSKQLQQEWSVNVEQRKRMPRPKGGKRAPKSLEQRRKIAEAISAKWADPEYRERVYAGLSKYHGTPVGLERATRRAMRRRSSGEAQPRRVSKKKEVVVEKSALNVMKMKIQQPRVKKRKAPLYEDPLASSKLEMIKNIRAQRAASEVKKNEALEQAKLLIAEAEKAAKALEVAARKNPIARASLTEARKLIAEAVHSIESIEKGQFSSHDNSVSAVKQKASIEKEIEALGIDSGQVHPKQVNGIPALEANEEDSVPFDVCKLPIPDSVNGRSCDFPSSFSRYQKNSEYSFRSLISDSQLRGLLVQTEPYGTMTCNGMPLPDGVKSQTSTGEVSSIPLVITKKWVRGRLVEVGVGE